jgi:preprotein translocase subunit SecE
MNFFSKITLFFKEVGLEMKKVNWPTKKEALKDTLIVISISVVVALFLGGLDIIIREVIKRIV